MVKQQFLQKSSRMGLKTSEQIFILFFVDIYACFLPCFQWICLINRAVQPATTVHCKTDWNNKVRERERGSCLFTMLNVKVCDINNAILADQKHFIFQK